MPLLLEKSCLIEAFKVCLTTYGHHCHDRVVVDRSRLLSRTVHSWCPCAIECDLSRQVRQEISKSPDPQRLQLARATASYKVRKSIIDRRTDHALSRGGQTKARVRTYRDVLAQTRVCVRAYVRGYVHSLVLRPSDRHPSLSRYVSTGECASRTDTPATRERSRAPPSDDFIHDTPTQQSKPFLDRRLDSRA